MAGYTEVRPINLFGDYLAGRQAALAEKDAQQQSSLRAAQLDRTQRLNALASNPSATPEQYIRAGDPGTGNALYGMQQQGDQDKQQALSQIAGLAQKVLSIQDPAQRKAFLASPEIAQVYGPAFRAIGADHGKGLAELQTLPDAEIQQRLQQVAQFAAPQKPIEVAPGASLVTPPTTPGGAYTPAFTAPGKPNEPPNAVQEYEYSKSQGYKGSFQQWSMDMKRAGATTVNLGAQGLSAPPTGYARPNPTKPGLIIEPGGPADPANAKKQPPGEADKKNAVLFSSMINAEKQIQGMKAGTDTSSIGDVALGSNPVTRLFQSGDYRKYEAAGLRWAANLLYLKSGATANPDEIRSTWKQFFPQPGDGADVKTQKEQARLQEIEAVRQNMVPGAPPFAASGTAPAPAQNGWTIKRVK